MADWLMLAVADEDRQHHGNEGYDDKPAGHYSWDSTVAHSKKPRSGDRIVLWDKNHLIGASVIEDIEVLEGVEKLRRRCPECGGTAIKARKTKTPRYRCQTRTCRSEFDHGFEEIIQVTTYRSQHGERWVPLDGLLEGSLIRKCQVNPKDQHSLRPLNWESLERELGADRALAGLGDISRMREASGAHTWECDNVIGVAWTDCEPVIVEEGHGWTPKMLTRGKRKGNLKGWIGTCIKRLQQGNNTGPLVSVPEDEEWLEEEFGAGNAWVIGAGVEGRLWEKFKEFGEARICPNDLGDLSQYNSREAIHKDLSDHRKSLATRTGETFREPVMDSLALWEFSHVVAPGDVILAKQGRKTLLGYGTVVEGYQHTLSGSAPPPIASEDGYTVEMAMKHLFIPRDKFELILSVIRRKKNVILQGPPGTGKTFIAKRVAWALMGEMQPDQVQMVQFHQSYSYEDFVQGWRPTEDGGFKLRNGVFYEFCKRAEQEPGKEFVFIIDEINRGNLSRIFGELLMLIEADKRGGEHSVSLPYSEEGGDFSVPENVHILGMMNTADRSLAMVDYALRRRFAYVDLEPAFGTQTFRSYLAEAGVENGLLNQIDQRMKDLNEDIRSDAQNLGPGFEIGHSYFVPSGSEERLDKAWYREIVNAELEPLLREYYEKPIESRERIEALLEELDD